MHIERVFVLFKPDCLSLELEKVLREEIKLAGLRIFSSRKIYLTEERARVIYRHILNEHFYQDLENFMLSGQCEALIICGVKATKKMNALKYGLRRKYSPNKIKISEREAVLWKENRHPRQHFFNVKLCAENLLHVSDSKKETERCINLFFKKKA